ncbi:MAG: matrixin family metalloprotease, partial [Phycisphaerales bacterium]
MNNRNLLITMTTLLAAGAGSAVAGPDCSESVCSVAKQVPDAIASSDELFMRDIAGRMINSLTLEEKMAIAAKNGIGSDALDLSHFTFDVDRSKVADIDPTITPREYRDLLFTPEMEARMSEGHLAMVEEIVKTLESENQPPALCFAPDMDREVALSINSLIEFRFSILFQQTNRWSNTATDGPGLQQGQPTTLTYSYIPDGTFVPNLGIGLGSGNSALFQWLNGIYGSPANWQPLFDQVFDRWSELTGLSYVFEPNDDGVNTNGAAGVLGVRGDVRIGAYDFQNDGNSGVLAYNNFPQDGDMIFDAFDTFYNNTGGNSLRFRNVTAHEHGHGLGMLHVCPAVGTKLMEPFISTAYDGPQLDDILNGQRHYGDPLEPNDNAASASDLGSFGVGSNVVVGNVSV